MTNRRSYGKLMSFPAWRLYDRQNKCVASVRAWSAKEARRLFAYHGITGHRMKKVVRRDR